MKSKRNRGFSLTEVLMAVGVLAVGMSFIAGVFPVAIHYMIVSSEKTISTVVADEAFAKIKLYGVNIDDPTLWPGDSNVPLDPNRTLDSMDFNSVSPFALNFYDAGALSFSEFMYPSNYSRIGGKKYCWAAICRRLSPEIDSRDVQVTVFISRISRWGYYYYHPDDPVNRRLQYPKPIAVAVDQLSSNELSIFDTYLNFNEAALINDGSTIVDNQTGGIYRVLERYAEDPNVIRLDRDWQGNPTSDVWVVPSSVNGGRGPCIGVFQEVIRF